jgi:hypothetical protein
MICIGDCVGTMGGWVKDVIVDEVGRVEVACEGA